MSLFFFALLATASAAGIPVNVVARQNNPDLPMMDFGDITNVPGLETLGDLGIPDIFGLLGAGAEGSENNDEFSVVQDMLLWAQDAAKMFGDPRFQSLEEILNSPGYTTFNDKNVESVNRELEKLANEYLSDNPAWATRTEWQQVWGPLFDIAPDANPFLYGNGERPTAVATGDAGKITSSPSANDDDEDEKEKDVSPSKVDSDDKTGGESDNKTGGESVNKTGGESDNKTGGESDNKTGGESDNKTGGESDNKTGGESDNKTADKSADKTGSGGAMTGTGTGGAAPSATGAEGWNASTSSSTDTGGSSDKDGSSSATGSVSASGSAPGGSPTASSSIPLDNGGISNSVSVFGAAIVFAAALI